MMTMMTWHNFGLFALPAVFAWMGGSVCAWLGTRKGTSTEMDAERLVGTPAGTPDAETDAAVPVRKKRRLLRAADALYLLGLIILTAFIAGLWAALERPPFRTTGETRLWYAFFMPLCGFLVYKRFRYAFVLACSTLLAAVFIGLNLLKPEIHDQTLMPALQSVWFVPHVMIYIFAYALLGVSFLLACFRLIRKKKDGLRGKEAEAASTLQVEDNLTRIGWICLSVGLFFGAIWAKQAWGHFWTWDPKETWAAATFLCYGLYLHLRIAFPKAETWAQAVQMAGFLLLQMCWYGLSLFPALGQSSIHLYN